MTSPKPSESSLDYNEVADPRLSRRHRSRITDLCESLSDGRGCIKLRWPILGVEMEPIPIISVDQLRLTRREIVRWSVLYPARPYRWILRIDLMHIPLIRSPQASDNAMSRSLSRDIHSCNNRETLPVEKCLLIN